MTTPSQEPRRIIYMLDTNKVFCTTATWWFNVAGYTVLDFQDTHLALDTLKKLTPEEISRACLLLDAQMPEMIGLEIHEELIQSGITGPNAKPALPVIYMTEKGDVPTVVKAMHKGAISFLEKPFLLDELEDALERAFIQAKALQSMVSESVDVQSVLPPCPEYASRKASLTAREQCVLMEVVEGKTNKQIARELDISPKTVEHHRRNVMSKMQAVSLLHLMRMVVNQSVD